jgi:outer membrane protein assembly factor BamB
VGAITSMTKSLILRLYKNEKKFFLKKNDYEIMTIQPENLLVCSTAGKIYAISKIDGSQIWKTVLCGVHDGVGSLFVFGDKVYVGMNGFLIALNLINGTEVWRNPLSGMGYNEVSLLVTNINSEGEGTSYDSQSSIVIVASYGRVYGIRSESGDILWKNKLKNGGRDMPSLIIDSPDKILVGCGKLVYKINIYDGKTIWQKKISNCLLGCSHVTMATHQSSLQNAFSYTGFCSNPIAQHAIKEKEKNKYEIAYGASIM